MEKIGESIGDSETRGGTGTECGSDEDKRWQSNHKEAAWQTMRIYLISFTPPPT
jgi:hypothetical protein